MTARPSASTITRIPAPPLTAAERQRHLVNVAVAAIGLLVTLPFMILIAIAIRLTSRGPVIYRQTRVGLDRRSPGEPDGNHRRHRNGGGRPFTMYKFRTMRVSDDSAQVWAKPNDDRVTWIGRILRKTRLDELPQLFNVLLGDMNVVGPRPEQPEIFVHLRERMPSYAWRQRVLPGITGWAQVNQAYDQNMEDVRGKVRLDLEYISRCSAIEDARIMARTFPVMFGRRFGW